MRFLLIGLAIVLVNLTTACSELALTKSPESATESTATDVQHPTKPEHTEQEYADTQPLEEQVAQSTEAESSPPAQLVENLKSVLSVETGIPSYEILLVSSETVDWPDSCLGLAQSDEFCAQVITPGYRIILGTLDREYEFHTDRSGENVRRKSEESLKDKN